MLPRLRRAVAAVIPVLALLAAQPASTTSASAAPAVRSPSGATTPVVLRFRQGVPVAVQLEPTGDGTRWSVLKGRLPDGVVLRGSGLLAGAPTVREERTKVLLAVGGAGRQARTRFTVVVRPTPAPVIGTDLPHGRTGQAYVAPVRPGGARAGTWEVVRGRLPAGLAVDRRTGTVSGSPTAPGTASFRLRFTEVTGRVATSDDEVAVVPDGGTGWASLRSDGSTTCGVQVDRTGWCWGLNVSGSVGDGTDLPRPNPFRLPGRWSWLDTRGGTTCGLRPDASAWCWGQNVVGTVGDGSGRAEVRRPTRLPGSWQEVGFNQQADGGGFDTVCGLRTDASLWCWGYDRYAQSGDGEGGPDDVQPVPHQVPGRFAGLPVGTGATRCAIDLEDVAWCWGANQTGQVGNGRTVGVYGGEAPHELPGRWASVTTGSQEFYSGTTCGVRTDGSGWCWGENSRGQVGDGTTTDALVPTRLPGSWTELATPAVRADPTCGLRPDGTAACWGANHAGGVGDGTTTARLTPYALDGTWTSLRTAAQTTCGVSSDGAGYCWGQDRYGAVGDGEDRRSGPATPTLLPGTWRTIDPEESRMGAVACGLRVDDSAWCWGDTSDGGAGSLPTDYRDHLVSPTRLAGPEGWATLDRAVRPVFSGTPCGIGTDGSGWCWGENGRATVGNGTLTDQVAPYGVVGGAGRPPGG